MLTISKFCLFVCALRSSFALPLVPDPQKLSEDVQGALMQVLGDFEPAGQNHTKANRWIVAVLNQVDNEQYVNAIISKIASINDVTLTAELVSLADGFHLIIPKNQEGVEEEHRITAIAIINMLMNLKTMERVDLILANSSLSSTFDVLFHGNGSVAFNEEKVGCKGAEYIKILFEHWLQSIVTAIENEPRLCKEFAEMKNAAGVAFGSNPIEVLSPLGISTEVGVKLAKKIMTSKLFRQTALNRIFLTQSSRAAESIDTDTDREQFLLGRALMDLAKHSDLETKMNQLYGEVLTNVSEALSESDVMEEMRDKLFSELQKKVEEDEELRKRVKEKENNLRIWIAFRGLRRNLALV